MNGSENQNQFEPKVKTELSTLTIILAVAVVLLLVGTGGCYLLVQAGQNPLELLGLRKQTQPAAQTQTEAQKQGTQAAIPAPPAIESSTEMAEIIVRTFYDNLAMSAPPLVDPIAPQMAIDLMTERAKETINVSDPSQASANLMKFAGVQNLPDQGFTIQTSAETANTIEVKTTWNYSSGAVTKTFILMQEAGNWKIDSVE